MQVEEILCVHYVVNNFVSIYWEKMCIYGVNH